MDKDGETLTGVMNVHGVNEEDRTLLDSVPRESPKTLCPVATFFSCQRGCWQSAIRIQEKSQWRR